MTSQERSTGPHQGQPVLTAGLPVAKATAALVLIHGRGATAQSILTLADELAHPDYAYLAPQAAGNTWYPYSFLAPIESNEPGLSSGLAVIASVLDELHAAGLSAERVMLLGFSQGACLALEFAARNARRYGGVIGLSGGLIGPSDTPRDYAGTLDGTPVFLGCSDIDPHIPLERVHETTDVMQDLGAEVTERIYSGMGHTVNQEELDIVRRMMAELSD